MKSVWHIIILLCILLLSDCNNRRDLAFTEDTKSKKAIQGIWISEGEEIPSFMIEGDTIFYPDAAMPAFFWINKDTLYIKGNNVKQYKICAISDDVFRFYNQNDEEVKLVRSTEKRFFKDFQQRRLYALNIFRTSDNDTLCVVNGIKYECQMRLEPGFERIIKSSYNDDGIEVDNVYLDNVGRLKILVNGALTYVHDFRKQEFSAYIPKELMNKSILRDLQFSHADAFAVYIDAIIGIPDASTFYVVELKIGNDGKLLMRLK